MGVSPGGTLIVTKAPVALVLPPLPIETWGTRSSQAHDDGDGVVTDVTDLQRGREGLEGAVDALADGDTGVGICADLELRTPSPCYVYSSHAVQTIHHLQSRANLILAQDFSVENLPTWARRAGRGSLRHHHQANTDSQLRTGYE